MRLSAQCFFYFKMNQQEIWIKPETVISLTNIEEQWITGYKLIFCENNDMKFNELKNDNLFSDNLLCLTWVTDRNNQSTDSDFMVKLSKRWKRNESMKLLGKLGENNANVLIGLNIILAHSLES